MSTLADCNKQFRAYALEQADRIRRVDKRPRVRLFHTTPNGIEVYRCKRTGEGPMFAGYGLTVEEAYLDWRKQFPQLELER